jgi:GT2 family glycosyltransferase
MFNPIASIIVLSYNGLEETTRPCLESIVKNTSNEAYELIIVDNASTDGTVEYLKSFAASHVNTKLHLNTVNKGYAGGNNDGLRLANGRYIVLLNNDTLVPEGWLDSLLQLFEVQPQIGLVGPITNSAGNEQRIELNGLTEFNYEEISAGYIKRQEGVWFTTKKLGFFCVAMRAEVPKQIGLLDEGFGLGMFEDDDYCVRAEKAGFQIAVTEACFVYHKGSMSFKKLDTEKYVSLFNKNRDYFFDKYNVTWTYADIAKSIFKIIYRDLNALSIELNSPPLERASSRLETLKNVLTHLGEVEERISLIHGVPLSKIQLNEKLNKTREISLWVDEMTVSIQTVSDWATKLSKENALLHEEIALLTQQIANQLNQKSAN